MIVLIILDKQIDIYDWAFEPDVTICEMQKILIRKHYTHPHSLGDFYGNIFQALEPDQAIFGEERI